MTEDNVPYGIGSTRWPGLAKLVEEMGELQQVLGKVMACRSGDDAVYWDGKSLRPMLVEEGGDTLAALIFFFETNGLDIAEVHERSTDKLIKFRYWHEQTRLGLPDLPNTNCPVCGDKLPTAYGCGYEEPNREWWCGAPTRADT